MLQTLDPADKLRTQLRELWIALNNNLSLVLMKLKDTLLAIKHASKVLVVEPDNTKARCRRLSCLLDREELNSAKVDLDRLLVSYFGVFQTHINSRL